MIKKLMRYTTNPKIMQWWYLKIEIKGRFEGRGVKNG